MVRPCALAFAYSKSWQDVSERPGSRTENPVPKQTRAAHFQHWLPPPYPHEQESASTASARVFTIDCEN
jgi:hypothetical protein